jgi:hypothetical protein
MASKYQNLSQFMARPLHSTEGIMQDSKFDIMYRKLVSKNGIQLYAVTEVESAFYYHIKVLSDTQQKNGVDYYYVNNALKHAITDESYVNPQDMERIALEQLSASVKDVANYDPAIP